MINEAQSLNIAKILSIENLAKIAHLIKSTPFSQITLFPTMHIKHILTKSRGYAFFENFDPLSATGMTFKLLTSEKFDPILAKIKRNFKNLENE